MSQFVKSLGFNENTKSYEPILLDSSGNLKISGSLTATGLNQETTQQAVLVDTTAIKNSVASVDGKITACDTSALATEATLLGVSLESTQLTVKSAVDNVKSAVDATNIALAGTLAVNDASAVSKLTSIDSYFAGVLSYTGTELNVVEQSATSILADTTAIKVSAASMDTKLGLVALETTQATMSGYLLSLDNKTVKADTDNVTIVSMPTVTETNSASQLAELQTLSGTVSAGKVQVEMATPSNKGSRGNISNNATIASNAVSASAPTITGYGANAHLYVEDATTGQVDGYAVEVSNDSGVNWQHHAVLFMEDNYNATLRVGSMKVNCSGLTNIRIRNIASVSVANCVASIYA